MKPSVHCALIRKRITLTYGIQRCERVLHELEDTNNCARFRRLHIGGPFDRGRICCGIAGWGQGRKGQDTVSDGGNVSCSQEEDAGKEGISLQGPHAISVYAKGDLRLDCSEEGQGHSWAVFDGVLSDPTCGSEGRETEAAQSCGDAKYKGEEVAGRVAALLNDVSRLHVIGLCVPGNTDRLPADRQTWRCTAVRSGWTSENCGAAFR